MAKDSGVPVMWVLQTLPGGISPFDDGDVIDQKIKEMLQTLPGGTSPFDLLRKEIIQKLLRKGFKPCRVASVLST